MQPSLTTKPLTLEDFFAYMDGITGRVGVEALRARLQALRITLDDVADHVHFSPHHYLRNLIHEGPCYHVLALCWRSGQRSPIHNHANSVCGVKVLTGVATETQFERTDCGLLKPTLTRDLHEGQVCVSADSDTHQVSNLQAPGVDLVTLHVYSPPLLKMETYSLTDGSVGEFIPAEFDHIHGSGI